MIGDLRVRLVLYSAGYMTDHWCDIGQVRHVPKEELGESQAAAGNEFSMSPIAAMLWIAFRRKRAPILHC